MQHTLCDKHGYFFAFIKQHKNSDKIFNAASDYDTSVKIKCRPISMNHISILQKYSHVDIFMFVISWYASMIV